MEAPDEIVDVLRDEGALFHDTPWGPVAVDFGDWEGEYRAFRGRAGLFRPPTVAQVEITGTQRAEFLNRLCTNKLDRILPGEGCETFLADANGRILHHVLVYAGPESLVLHTAAGLGPKLCSHLDYYLIREDVQFHDRSLQWGELILAGPQSANVLQLLLGENLPSGDGYLANFNAGWDGRPLMIRRLQERGFQNFQLAGETVDMGTLWRALRQLGATACGMRALESVRIEEGFPVIGLDITEKTLPQEVGRNEKAISLTKGCYLGQEIVARIDSRGAVNKILSGIRFQTSDVPPSGGKLTHGGQAAGQITSAAYSPGFGVSVALAYVGRQFHEPGTVLDSAWGPATIVELPMRSTSSISD
ncbi:MAG: glycine cleavage T C-terminal barrel domain-containing protein [Thermoguttaceae bacterium]|jgi:folate-binding protein YgfZ